MPVEPYIPENVRVAADAADAFLKGATSPESATAIPSSDPPAQAPAPAPTPQLEAAEQRYRVLQGKYNAEVPRLNEANRELRSQNSVLSQRLQELEAKVSELSAPKVSSESFDNIHKEFGDDLTNVLKEQAATIERLNRTIAQLQQGQERVVTATAETAQAAFWRELRRDVPDFDTLNSDPYFLAWLDESDGLSGYTRYDTLQAQFKRLDAQAVARYFTSYKSGLKPATNNLAGLESPPASGGQAPPPGDKPIFTSAEVSKFFKELALGKWNHRMEEARVMEKNMELAQIEGRIR